MTKVLKLVAAAAAMVGFAATAQADWTVTTDAQGNVTSVTDGNWVIPASGTREAIALSSPTSRGSSTVLDLSQPIVDGGAFVSIPGHFMSEYQASSSKLAMVRALTELKLPETIVVLPGGAFWGCSSLKKVTLSTKTTTIGENAFTQCTSLAEVTPFLPDTVTTLAPESFGYTTNLKIPFVSTVKGRDLLYNGTWAWDRSPFVKSGITSVDLSESTITQLPDNLFRNCRNLSWVKLPATLTSSGGACFYDCVSLKEIAFRSFPTFGVAQFGNTPKIPNMRITYPASCTGWADFFANNPTHVSWDNAGKSNQDAYTAKFGSELLPVGYATVNSSTPTDAKSPNDYIGQFWMVPIPVVTDVELFVSGTPSNIGTVEPGYGDIGKVEDPPLTCTAPEHVVAGDFVWRCTGYKLGKLIEGEIVYGGLVESCTCEFNPEDEGRYYLQWQWEKAACKVTIGAFPASVGSVAIAEDPYLDFEGYYPIEQGLTLTATGASGTFDRWLAGAPKGQERTNPLVVTLNAAATFTPYFACDWTLADDGKSVTDGYWVIPVSGAREALALAAPTTNGGSTILDLRRPVIGGGAFASIASSFMSTYAHSPYCAILTEVHLPETVTVIPGGAFWGCTKLQTVTLSSQTTVIGENAFLDCTSLASVTPFLPDTVTSIVWEAFRNTKNLKLPLSLKAPGLKEIGADGKDWTRGQFMESGITSVDMSGSGLTNIGQRTFSDCEGLKTVVLPEKLERIGVAAFCGCSALTTMTPLLPATLRYIGWASFCGCGKLRGDLVVANRKATAEGSWNSGNYSDSNFYRCGLDTIDLSNARGMTVIPKGFVRESPNLCVIKYPKTVQYLGECAHFSCGKLADIQFRSWPQNFATPTDAFGSTPGSYKGRIVYPVGDAGWEAYIAEQKAAGNFTAWEDAGANANTYLSAFPDHWKPVGYVTVHKGATYGNVGKWLVPRNFDVGTMIFVQ